MSRDKSVIKLFLSYSTKDYYFAELAGIKLAEAELTFGRTRPSLSPEWIGGRESN